MKLSVFHGYEVKGTVITLSDRPPARNEHELQMILRAEYGSKVRLKPRYNRIQMRRTSR